MSRTHTDFDVVIGLVGLKAAGKDTFADMLKADGFVSMRVSDAIRREAADQGIAHPTTTQLQDISDRIKREKGPGYWVERLFEGARAAGHRKVIVNGVRNPGEIVALRREAWDRVVLVGIVAPTLVRFDRFLKRPQDAHDGELASFLAMDDRDRGVGQPPEGQQVDRCLAQVPYENIYLNTGTRDEYRAWIDALLARI